MKRSAQPLCWRIQRLPCGFLLAILFSLLQSSQTAAQNDTLHFQLCIEMWNDGRPVTGATLIFQPNNPAFPYSPIAFNLNTAQSCAAVTVVQSDYLPGTTFSYTASMPDTGALNGVSVIDLCNLSQHILGINPLSSPYAIFAGDVNKSGSLTTFDLVESRKMILGIYTDFPSQVPWQIYPDYCQFSNPANPFSGNCQTEISLSELMLLEGDTAKVIAVKSGDVNGDVRLNNEPFIPVGNLDSLTLIMPQGPILAGSNIVVPLKFDKDFWFGGIQTNLYLNPSIAQLDSISSGAIYLPFPGSAAVFFNNVTGSLRTVSSGDLTTSPLFIPAGAPLFYLHIKVLQDAQLEDVLKMITTDLDARNFAIGTNCTGYFKMGAVYTGSVPVFSPEISGLRVQTPSPNPYGESTFLGLELESPETATLEVSDLTGRVLYAETKNLPMGNTRWEIPAATLHAGSMGIWRLRVKGQMATGKLMRR